MISTAVATKKTDISWIYAFWKSIEPWIFVREEDNVIIVPPNRVYKANATAMNLARHLSSGGRLEDIPDFEGKAPEIEAFFRDLESVSRGIDLPFEALSYDFSFTRLPVLGEIAVSYACNKACRFCYAGDPGGLSVETGAGLSASDLERIIDIFKDEAKIPFFSFTGGEPLLRTDLERFIAYAVTRGLRVNLVTNGTKATKERAKSLKDAGLGSAQVSIESPDRSIHDRLCGAQGSWKESVAGLEALRDAGIPVQTNSTITLENRDSLLEMPGFIASLGIARFAMNLYIPARHNADSHALFVSYTELGPLVDAVCKKAKKLGLQFLWYSPTPLCIFNPIARGLGNKSCAACDGLLSVSPRGDILPCSSYPESVGNILEKPFADVWFSRRALFFKHKGYAPHECGNCGSFVACQAACPLYWDYAGYGELEAVWASSQAARSGGNT